MEIGNQGKEINRSETGGGPPSSSFGIKNKRKLVMVLGIVVILAAVVGIFYWFNIREIKGSPDDYAIIQASNGNTAIIENQRAGLKVRAPEGWDIERIDLLEGSMAFYTKDAKGEWRNEMINPPLEKGCAIGSGVTYEKMDFKKIKEEIKDIHFGLGIISEEFEEIKINNRTGLKNTFDSQVLGPCIVIYFTENNKLYSFGVNWGPDDKQRCIKEFEEMLYRVEIE